MRTHIHAHTRTHADTEDSVSPQGSGFQAPFIADGAGEGTQVLTRAILSPFHATPPSHPRASPLPDSTT